MRHQEYIPGQWSPRGKKIPVSHPFSLQDMSPPLHMLLSCGCNPRPTLGQRLLLSITLPLGGAYLANILSFLYSLPLFPEGMHILAGSVGIQRWQIARNQKTFPQI